MSQISEIHSRNLILKSKSKTFGASQCVNRMLISFKKNLEKGEAKGEEAKKVIFKILDIGLIGTFFTQYEDDLKVPTDGKGTVDPAKIKELETENAQIKREIDKQYKVLGDKDVLLHEIRKKVK